MFVVVNYKISIKKIPFTILVYNIDNTLNKNEFIKEFVILQLVINNHYKCIDLIIIELRDIDLFLGYD